MKCPECSTRFVDAAGAAKILGVSKGRFHNLLAESVDAPRPVLTVGRSPLWLEWDVREFGWVRPKRGGSRVAASSSEPVLGEAAELEVVDHPCTGRFEVSDASGGVEHAASGVERQGRRWVAACVCGWLSPPMPSEGAAGSRLGLHLSSQT